MNSHSQSCPIYNGRECDCNYREQDQRQARASELLVALGYVWVREDENWIPWQARAALALQSTPVAPAVEQAPTAAQIEAFTSAWNAYWERTDAESAGNPKTWRDGTSRNWRNGSATAAIRVSLAAALAQSTPHVPAGERAQQAIDAIAALAPVKLKTFPYAGRYRCQQCRFEWGGDLGSEGHTMHCAYAIATSVPHATPRPPEPAAPVAQEPVPAGAQGVEGRVHDLKCWTSYYRDVASGKKPFEVRVNDRDYRVGDWLKLRDWNVETESYSGHECRRQVTYVLTASEFVKEGMAILGLATPATEPAAPGYLSVPVEPTRAMIEAAVRCRNGDAVYKAISQGGLDVMEEEALADWQAMLAAASTVQGKEKP